MRWLKAFHDLANPFLASDQGTKKKAEEDSGDQKKTRTLATKLDEADFVLKNFKMVESWPR